MTSIRIVIAAALLFTVGFAGSAAHDSRSQATMPARAVAQANAPAHNSPPLCCW